MDTTPTQPRHELELLTEAALAAFLKVCRRQLYKWRIAGLIPSFKLGRAVRFRASGVLAAPKRCRASLWSCSRQRPRRQGFSLTHALLRHTPCFVAAFGWCGFRLD
jgi:hypothetical protein